ncbi:MAG TPA: UDP-2,3-diacylglucosamine diphosphatase [Saprospiraceae bacterium]|nr:UDP-2,3-diacylglucosamine diphosphatase [Saprospiraceae bacterium]
MIPHKSALGAIYFASDFHLKSHGSADTTERERRVVRWLDQAQADMDALYLVGDVFDFWFDYRKVIPRGFVRLLGKLAEIRDKGIPIYFFTGNHDLWMFDYLQKELGIPIYHQPIEVELQGKKLLIGHGDGLGPGDHGYKRLKKLFSNPLAQFLFRWIHPDLGIGLADYFSSKSREAQQSVETFLGPEQEWLIQYAEKKIQTHDYDYLVFGHRHLPIAYPLSNDKSSYFNLGDWIRFQSYGVLREGRFELRFFENPEGRSYPDRLKAEG